MSTVGFEPLIGWFFVRAGLRPEVLTTWLYTDLYLRSDFISMCFGNMVETKEIQFLSFSKTWYLDAVESRIQKTAFLDLAYCFSYCFLRN